jgi:hypothetical protein
MVSIEEPQIAAARPAIADPEGPGDRLELVAVEALERAAPLGRAQREREGTEDPEPFDRPLEEGDPLQLAAAYVQPGATAHRTQRLLRVQRAREVQARGERPGDGITVGAGRTQQGLELRRLRVGPDVIAGRAPEPFELDVELDRLAADQSLEPFALQRGPLRLE